MNSDRENDRPRIERGVAGLVFLAVFFWLPQSVSADDIPAELQAFIQKSCIGCHDANTESRLNFAALSHDLSREDTFREWVRVFDRVERGEMPPAGEPQPSAAERQTSLAVLRSKLHEVSRRVQQTVGRVPSRRLTRSEYQNVLHDLLEIDRNLAKQLPAENRAAGAFDVVAATQDMSSVHVRSFLQAARLALDEAIQLGSRPEMKPRELNYLKSRYIRMWVDRPVRNGGGTVFTTERDVITFRGENFVLRSDHNGYRISVPGRYRITVRAAAHQPRSAVTLSLKRQNDEQGESELFAAWDLKADFRDVSTIKYLRPDDYFYVSADELEPAPDGRVIYNSQPASQFAGEGVRIRRVTVEGPLESAWPPQRTRRLFPGIEWGRLSDASRTRAYGPVLHQSPLEHARNIIGQFAARAWRRGVSEEEVEALAALAKPHLQSDRDFIAAVRVPLRTILVSPELLFQTGPAGPLTDPALAMRLSCFLWRGLPDDALLADARQSRLSEPGVLRTHVDRMLQDPRSRRFTDDFLGQWLGLDRIDATTPDAYLYPEYDDVLRAAMVAETREFFAHMIRENLSVDHLVDSDFTFLNRRLAEHYGIAGVEGEEMRKVMLDAKSVRGGILAQAAIAKITANGTVTTPVKRGNFVLTNVLGLPPNPPPPGVGAIEPDTRGATTIRETLQKHQSVEACAVCHRRIDPPGFALECFDPVGNFRQRYRNSRGVTRTASVGLRFLHKDYDLGLPVDASGVTEDGFRFADIREYKAHLRKSSEQIARNVLSKLIAFATGAEIQFADREEVERILDATRENGFPLRSLIHHVVASRMFRNR